MTEPSMKRELWTTVVWIYLLSHSDKVLVATTVVINGPNSFITDGTRQLTLRCIATDAPSGSTFAWNPPVIVCIETAPDQGNCTFTPGIGLDGTTIHCTVIAPGGNTSQAGYTLHLQYPPESPPEITSSRPGQILTDGDHVTCTIKGGKPPVSSINFNCSNPDLEGEPSATGNASTVTVDTSHATLGGMTCTCRATWDPETELYPPSNGTFRVGIPAVLEEFTLNGTSGSFNASENEAHSVFLCKGSGFPSPEIILSVGSNVLARSTADEDVINSTLTYTLPSVTRRDMGRYSCVAGNGIRDGESQHIQLNVLSDPRKEDDSNSLDNPKQLTPDGLSFIFTSYPMPDFWFVFLGEAGDKHEALPPDSFTVEASRVSSSALVVCTIKRVDPAAFLPGKHSVNVSNMMGGFLYYFEERGTGESKDPGGLGADAIAGITVGCIVLLCLVTAVVLVVRWQRKRPRYQTPLPRRDRDSEHDYTGLRHQNDVISLQSTDGMPNPGQTNDVPDTAYQIYQNVSTSSTPNTYDPVRMSGRSNTDVYTELHLPGADGYELPVTSNKP